MNVSSGGEARQSGNRKGTRRIYATTSTFPTDSWHIRDTTNTLNERMCLQGIVRIRHRKLMVANRNVEIRIRNDCKVPNTDFESVIGFPTNCILRQCRRFHGDVPIADGSLLLQTN